MTNYTRRMFERIGPAPDDIAGHVPAIRIRGSCIAISCSCGRKLGGGRGCNRSGMDYAICWAKNAFVKHVCDILDAQGKLDTEGKVRA